MSVITIPVDRLGEYKMRYVASGSKRASVQTAEESPPIGSKPCTKFSDRVPVEDRPRVFRNPTALPVIDVV